MPVASRVLAGLSLLLSAGIHAQTVPVPAAITADGVPALPASLAADVRPYLEARSAAFQGWDPVSRGVLITTRFGNAAQLHLVKTPLGARTQLSFEAEPVPGGQYSKSGDVLLVARDRGGDEFYQLYRLDSGRLTLLTDGRSRNTGAVFSRDGRMVGYASSRRNGRDSDLYLIDPRDPKSDRLLAQLDGGGWSFSDFSPSGTKALVLQYLSAQQSRVYEVDLASGILTRLNWPGAVPASFDSPRYGADGRIWVLSDVGSDVKRLGTISAATGFVPLNPGKAPWDVEEFALSEDGQTIATVTNEAGISRLRLLSAADGRVLAEPKLPVGVIGGLEFAPWGELGFTLTNPTSPADVWSLNPGTGALTRWTQSETGGLDPMQNRPAELVTVKSFDGLPVSGFLFQPDPARFPGKRPLIIDIHGGPEGQSRPGFQGAGNYLVNELGIAVFKPNVRGSAGYGKRFISLDNGPFRREDSVKDIGAFLDVLAARPGIDPARIAVQGGSYGGYMCYASAIRYGARLRAAQCTVAISSFVTFLENTQAYRRDLRRVEYGDERVPAQRAKLTEISPLTRAGELKIPLLIVTGGNDPRVPASEAEQMLKAVRSQGVPAWHVLAANEGHGFRKKENRDYQFLAELAFWKETLLK